VSGPPAPCCSLTGWHTAALTRRLAGCVHHRPAALLAGCSGPFNLSSNTVLRVEGTISGSRNPSNYPIVTQQPYDEAYRAPYMLNRQRQALISAYSAQNISVIGSGTVDGNGWDWWYGVSHNPNGTYNRQVCRGGTGLPVPTAPACMIQRPKLLEFVDCKDVLIGGTATDRVLTFKNSPFWTLHPTFCVGVRMANLSVLAPRDHGNTDGVDPDSCDDVHVTDVTIDVGDDAVSVKSGLHWKTKQKVAAQNYLFERVTILHRNFAIGSDVSGDVLNVTFRDSVIGDEHGSSPWAIKLKTDSQEGGVVDGIRFLNLTIGNITYCGSSAFVYNPPHSAPPPLPSLCPLPCSSPGRSQCAAMIGGAMI
jgi:polygalacturonase